MNRRRFFRFLGIGAATAAVTVVAPELLKEMNLDGIVGSLHGFHYDTTKTDVLGDYGDYTSFSEFARKEAIDDMVHKAAIELGKKAAEEFNNLHRVYG